MTYLIIMGVVFLALFLSRNWWADKIGAFTRRRREGKDRTKTIIESEINTKAIFSPSGTKRTFIIALEIEERGNGTVDISLAKIKQPDV
jgi:hypothetical protein